MNRVLVGIGAVLGLIGVGAGAFGAHGLEGRLDEEALATWDLAARYQMVHAVAIFAAGIARSSALSMASGKLWAVGVWLLVGGVAVFSGTLYALALTGIGWLGAVTPIGGTALLVGWAALAAAAFRARR
jgi:uncharacterized membrane protein YgdD (TMEM256/DUF423 family)